MRHRVLFVLVLCLAAVAVLGIGASAAAADPNFPGVSTAHLAHVWPLDGSWWSGGAGWGDSTAHPAGTPIPAGDDIVIYGEVVLPVKADAEGARQGLLLSVTVKGPRGDVIVRTTEAESPQFWWDVRWYPAADGWWRGWEVFVGQLPAGNYQITFVMHQPETAQIWDYDESGNLVLTVVKAFKWTFKSSFTVQ
jgi:hypothetical protein